MKYIITILLCLFVFSAADAQIFRKKSKTVSTTYQLVDSLPTSIGEGVLLLFEGTLWRGLAEGESALPAGTPAPISLSHIPSDTLPDSIGSRDLILFEGQLWRGLEEDESALATGTPWPIKGYKEITFEYEMGAADSTSSAIIKTDGITGLTFTGTWESVVISFGTGVTNDDVVVVSGYTVVDVATTTPFLAHAVPAANASVSVVVDSAAAAYDAIITVRFYPPPPAP